MIANYHTHTARCMHACGGDEEYVQKAIAEGVRFLGFSDHAPFPYRGGYVSYYKMRPDEAAGYFASIRDLGARYGDRIELAAGYEAEFYPELWSDAIELWRREPPAYLILGQHFTDFEFGGGAYGDHSYRDPAPTDRERLVRYADRVVAGLSTERFSCLAHPDVLTFSGELDFYREQMGRIIGAAKRYGVPLEFNLLGFAEGRLYPRREFWELVAESGGSAVLGCDAHSPARVADAGEIEAARAFLASLGVPILETIELRDPLK